jgi:hypothetical protein
MIRTEPTRYDPDEVWPKEGLVQRRGSGPEVVWSRHLGLVW